MAATKRRFRPMGLGDLLDEAFDIYKSNFVLLAGICAVIYVPLYFLYGYASSPAVSEIGRVFSGHGATSRPPSELQPFGGVSPFAVAFWVLFGPAYTTVTGALMYAVSRRLTDESATIGTSYEFVRRKLGALITTMLLIGVIALGIAIAVVVIAVLPAVGIGFATGSNEAGMALAVLGVVAAYLIALFLVSIVMLRLFFGIPSVLLEGKSRIAALRRGWDLCKGHWLRVFGIMFLTSLVVGIVGMIPIYGTMAVLLLTARSQPMVIGLTLGAVMAIVETAIAPVSSIMIVLLYYDLRIRKEGFDLQMLARDLTIARGETPPDYYTPAVPVPITPAVAVHPGVCGHCKFPITDTQQIVECTECHVTYHKSCWDEHKGCANWACRPDPEGAAQT